MEKNQSVHTIILNQSKDQVLLVKRRDIPVWVLPGGGIDLNESPEAAAVRESHEETGLNVVIEEKIGVYTPRNKLSNISHIYECRVESGKTVLTTETQAINWFYIEDLPPMPPPYPEWISDALTNTLPRPFTKKVVSVNYWAFVKHCILHPILMGRFLLSRIGIHLNS